MTPSRPCEVCGNPIWGPVCPNHGMYDPIADQHFVGQICPYCGVTLMAFLPDEGGEIREEFKENPQTRYLPDTRRKICE